MSKKLEQFQFAIGDFSFTAQLILNDGAHTIELTAIDEYSNLYTAQISQELFKKQFEGQFQKIQFLYQYVNSKKKSEFVTFQNGCLTVRSRRSIVEEEFIDRTFAIPMKVTTPEQAKVNQDLFLRVKILENQLRGREFTEKQELRFRELQKMVRELSDKPRKYFFDRQYSFSETQKAGDLKVSQNGKFCEKIVGAANQNSFVLLENTLGKQHHKLEIKIHNIANIICFGIGNIKNLQTKLYIDPNGCSSTFAIATNATTYGGNGQHTLGIVKGDIIVVQVVDNKILFYKQNTLAAVVLQLPFEQKKNWHEVCLYAMFVSAGDSLMILN